MAASSVSSRPSIDDDTKDALFLAAVDGDLARIKDLIQWLKQSRNLRGGAKVMDWNLKLVGQEPVVPPVLSLNSWAGTKNMWTRNRFLPSTVKNQFFVFLWAKAIVKKSLGTGTGKQAAVFSLTTMHGFGVLHLAANQGHLEVCKYLLEELGGDPNITADGGLTPVMVSAQADDVSIVKYLLDHGGELLKSDDNGLTVLHHAVSTGSCKVTKFLLSKGIPVDIDFGHGTPLYQTALAGQDKTMKILLDHHANPNTIFSGISTPLVAALIKRSLKCMKLLIKAGADINSKGTITSPLLTATTLGGYTKFIQFLLEAGADPNIPDELGRLPIEIAASNDCREEVEMLFPMTLPIPNVSNWSIDGVISHAKLKSAKPLDESLINENKDLIKSQANMAFKRKDYELASQIYGLVLDSEPDATLYSNRSLCRLLMGDGEGALSDACKCRLMRPDWAKACYRQAAAHMLLKEYKHAHDALLDAQKLDPRSDEIKRELRKATELLKTSREA